jgi:Protein of unknown function (DUF998)
MLTAKPLRTLDLQNLMTRSFFAMRWAMFGIGVALPPALWIWLLVVDTGHPLPNSLSGYYHTDARNLFVGALVASGLLLFLYKAFDTIENLLLNVAGVAAIGVAFFPCKPDPGATDGSTAGYWEHGVFALITFGGMGLVAVFFASSTVKLLPERLRPRFAGIYRILGLLMIAAPVVAIVVTRMTKETHATFWVEVAGLYAFAAYWLVKTIEYRRTNAERKAVSGTLDLTAGPASPPPVSVRA